LLRGRAARGPAFAVPERERREARRARLDGRREGELERDELRPSGSADASRQTAGEGEEHACDHKGGEGEGELQEDAEQERWLGRGLVRKGARREEALRQLLEGEAKRGQENEEQKATRRSSQAGRPSNETDHADDSDEEGKSDNERAVCQVRMPSPRKLRATVVRVGYCEPIGDFMGRDPARNGEGEDQKPRKAGPPRHARHGNPGDASS
jgi:hypothetical protein